MSVTKDMSIIKDIMIALEFKAIDYYKISGKWPFWYDDAMAWLREQYEQTSPVLSNSCKTGKDEKDERIRKALIRFFGAFPYERLEHNGVSAKEAIAWLEKQGAISADKELYEHIRNTCACIDDALSSESVVDIKDYLEQASDNAHKAFEWMEKRMETPNENEGKISPKWSKEDEEEFIIAIETLYEAGQHSSAMWLKSIKQRIVQ